ncbi:MAG TPA: carbohydrate ABC transporter permease [Thermomicrobiales bacterium]|nr:carbohydrate ABC transporter permease [Thermomicrobiales bacterium]
MSTSTQAAHEASTPVAGHAFDKRQTTLVGRFNNPRFREVVFTLLLLPLAIVWIYPFLWMVSAALKTDQEIFGGLGLIPETFQWSNFARAWTDARVGDYFLNTLIITFSSVLIVVTTTAMMGYVLGRYQFPGKKAVIGFFVATVFLPEGYTIIPVFELINFLNLGDSLAGVILAQSGGAHVVTILLFAGYFSQLPKELEEAAILDGAGFLRIFWQIFLPLTKPVVATAIIMQFMYSWNDFLLPLVLTLSRPDLRTLSVGIYSFQGEFFTDWSGMAAAATISLLPIIIVFLFLQRYFVEGIAGAVKS